MASTCDDRQFCTVCQHDIDDSEERSTTKCMHVFHYDCLAQALCVSNTCPTCREELREGEEAASEQSSDSGFASLDFDSTLANRDPFVELIRGLEHLSTNGQTVDINVSVVPPADPPRQHTLPPTPANIIHYATIGNVNGVESMLSHNRELARACTDSGDTLLHIAVTYQHEYLVRRLTVNATIHVNSMNRARMSPLHYAVSLWSADLVQVLLDAGSYVDACDASGKTPLMHAAASDNAGMCKQLILYWANVNATDTAGDTPIHHAARCGCYGAVRVLSTLTACRVDMENHLGETALHLACARGSPSCVRYLVIAGASQVKKDRVGRVPRQRVPHGNTATLAPLVDL